MRWEAAVTWLEVIRRFVWRNPLRPLKAVFFLIVSVPNIFQTGHVTSISEFVPLAPLCLDCPFRCCHIQCSALVGWCQSIHLLSEHLHLSSALIWSRYSYCHTNFQIYCFHFQTLSQNGEKRLLTSSRPSSVCPSVWPRGTTRLPLDGFLWNFVFKYFS